MVCKNCKRLLPQQINYCNGCGAKVIRNRLTLRNLFEDFVYRYLNYDNQFLRTFIHLFTKPEAVISSYIHGTRKKYVNVISYFAIALTLSGLQMFIINKFFPELMNVENSAQQQMEGFNNNNLAFIQEYQSIIAMLFVPIYALISKLVFFNYKKYNFTEHLVINMYLFGHITIVSSIVVILISFFGVNFIFYSLYVILPVQILYSAYGFKSLYNLSLGKIIIKTLFFCFILLVVFILLVMLTVLVLFLTGGFDGAIEKNAMLA